MNNPTIRNPTEHSCRPFMTTMRIGTFAALVELGFRFGTKSNFLATNKREHLQTARALHEYRESWPKGWDLITCNHLEEGRVRLTDSHGRLRGEARWDDEARVWSLELFRRYFLTKGVATTNRRKTVHCVQDRMTGKMIFIGTLHKEDDWLAAREEVGAWVKNNCSKMMNFTAYWDD